MSNKSIFISFREDDKVGPFAVIQRRRFLTILRGQIACKTTLCYHMPPVNSKIILSIPIDVLGNDDVEKKLLQSKLAELRRFLKVGIDYKSLAVGQKRWISLMESIPPVVVSSPLGSEIIEVRDPFASGIERITIERSNDAIQIISPYESSALIAFDLSKEFKDMALQYNALHFFEHIMCSNWVAPRGVKNDKLLTMNGFTNEVGICFVYTVSADKQTAQRYYDKEIDLINNARVNGFSERDIHREVSRTISETKTEPFLCCFARNAGKAFDYEYSHQLLNYWVNQPIRCLIISPWRITTRRATKPRAITRPAAQRFSSLPFEVSSIKSCGPFIHTSSKTTIGENAAKLKSWILNGEQLDGTRMGVDITMQYYVKTSASNSPLRLTKVSRDEVQFLPAFMLSTCADEFTKVEYSTIVKRVLLSVDQTISVLDDFATPQFDRYLLADE